jgi:ligand-binding sensor domain-containing protein/signal transduction histidine kinase
VRKVITKLGGAPTLLPALRSSRFLGALLTAVLLAAVPGSTATAASPGSATRITSETASTSRPQQSSDGHLEGSQQDGIEFEHLSIEQGLSQSSVLCMLQDSRGFMWFGTADGLNRYDGYEFTVYKHDPDDPHTLSQGAVYSIYEDQVGMLWIRTASGGIDRYDRETGRFTRYRHEPDDPGSLSDDFVWDIYEDAASTMWIGTYAGGLCQYDREADRFIHYRHDPADPHSLSHDKVYAMYEDRAGVFWVGTAGGLNRFERETGRFTHYRHNPQDPQSLGSDLVQLIYEDRAGRFWVTTFGSGLDQFDRETGRAIRYQHDPDDPQSIDKVNRILEIHQDRLGFLWLRHFDGRLDRFDPKAGTFTRYRHDPDDPHSLSHDAVTFVAEDRAGNLWIGTADGLDRFDWETGHFIHYRHDASDPHSLSDNQVLSFCEDRAGVLWIGTLGQGLNLHDPAREKFAHYRVEPNAPDGMNNNMVFAIYKDSEGVLWIGTEAGLNRFDLESGDFAHYQHDPDDPHSPSAGWVWSIHEDQEGTLWIGTDTGLDKLNRETGHFTHYQDIPGDSGNGSWGPIPSIVEDRSGALWLGVRGGGLWKFSPDTEQLTHYDHRPDSNQWYRDYAVNSVYVDRTGTLWMGTNGGLWQFDRGAETFIHYQHDPDDRQSLSYDEVISIYEDRSGVLWVGTNGGGLNKFDRTTGTFTHYTQKDGLPNDVVYGILEEDASPDGAGARLWLSTNRGLSKFNPRTGTFRNYDVGDGLQSNEFNIGAYHKARDGEMFFGGVNGFNAFYPDSIQDNPYVPPVMLTSLTQSGEDVDLGKAVESVTEVTFHWPDNFFEFEFAALSYSQPEKNQYAYMLEGFDENWSYIRFGRYTNLPGGTYLLRIKGSNSDGVWNEEGVSIKVTIVPPFWGTWWFRGITLLGLVGGVIGGYRLRVKSIETRSRELERQVEERTYALEQRTREIERRRQELEALYRADAELHRHLRLDEVLQALVDIVVDLLQADKSSLIVWDDQREKLVVRVARGFRPETLVQMSFTPDQGTVGHVATTGEPVIVEDARTDPRVAKHLAITEPEGIRSFMQVPIQVGGEVFGVFSADYVHPRAFGDEEQRLFTALAQRAALAVDTAQLYERTQELAVVEERQRLARDLHDAVTQTLFSASLIAETLPALWESDQQEGRQLLKELQQLSRGALAEMRGLLLELRPAALAEASLGDLLRHLAEAVTGRTGVPVRVTAEGHCALPSDVHVALYRIAQEALNNAVKHARASQVAVSLRCAPPAAPLSASAGGTEGGRVELRVSDDGRGFDPSAIPPDRLGLGIIRERAQAVGATLEIESRPGHGTRLIVVWETV